MIYNANIRREYTMNTQKTVYLQSQYIILLVIGCFCLINQGGYFEGGIIFAGLSLSCLMFHKKNRFTFTIPKLLYLLFSVWYFICSVKSGYITEFACRGLLPFVVFLMMTLSPESKDGKEQFLTAFMRLYSRSLFNLQILL